MKDLERERAADALAAVKRVMECPDDVQKNYRSYVDRFGGAVVMNGLGQALATELAAGEAGRAKDEPSSSKPDKEAHQMLADNVSAFLSREDAVYEGESDVMTAIVSSDQAVYLRAQAEVLAWLTWHKKFCHAYLPKGSGD